MKKLKRITAALDESTLSFLEKISSQDKVPLSEVIRRALEFYHENRVFPKEKLATYMALLSGGEHIIIDIDHWLLFLDFIQSSQNQDAFWTKHREVARSHAEQLRKSVVTAEDILNRLEACNFFKVIKHSETDFTLVLGSELPKKFVIVFLEEFFSALGIKGEVKANLAKITVHTTTMPRRI